MKTAPALVELKAWWDLDRLLSSESLNDGLSLEQGGVTSPLVMRGDYSERADSEGKKGRVKSHTYSEIGRVSADEIQIAVLWQGSRRLEILCLRGFNVGE